MIFDWFSNNNYRNFEKITGALFDLGIASRKQLLSVSSFSPPTLDRTLRELNKKELIIVGSLPDHRSVYRLSQKGVLYSQSMTRNSSIKVAPESQIGHFLGLNDILERMVETFGRNFDWFNTREAADYLFTLRLVKGGINEADLQKTYIRPDAFVKFENQHYWIEFDNSTETSTQLLKKFRMYITNLNFRLEGYQNVIWITKDAKRRDFIKKIWTDYENDTVEMHFFSAGEEILMLKRLLDKNSSNNQDQNELSNMIELS